MVKIAPVFDFSGKKVTSLDKRRLRPIRTSYGALGMMRKTLA